MEGGDQAGFMAEVGVVPDPERGEAAGPGAGNVGEGREEGAVDYC